MDNTSSMYLSVKLNWNANRFLPAEAHRGGAEVAGLTLDQKIRVRFPAYPHRVWALWWQGGKRGLRTFQCPCRGRLGTLKTLSCPWRGCPAAGQNLETWHLSRHYIAEISLNVTLNHNRQQQQLTDRAQGLYQFCFVWAQIYRKRRLLRCLHRLNMKRNFYLDVYTILNRI